MQREKNINKHFIAYFWFHILFYFFCFYVIYEYKVIFSFYFNDEMEEKVVFLL